MCKITQYSGTILSLWGRFFNSWGLCPGQAVAFFEAKFFGTLSGMIFGRLACELFFCVRLKDFKVLRGGVSQNSSYPSGASVRFFEERFNYREKEKEPNKGRKNPDANEEGGN